MIWLVIWTCLMILWIAHGVYGFDRAQPYGIGGTIIPWFCVLILGLVIFGAVSVGPVNQPAVIVR